MPWYWAEVYFYRRVRGDGLLSACAWQGVDPYAAKKRVEWAPDPPPRAVAQLLESLPEDPEAQFEQLLHAALWGNRTDLSYMVAADFGADGRAG